MCLNVGSRIHVASTGTDDLTKANNNENSDCREEENNNTECNFFTPCHLDIFTLHFTKPTQERRGNPPSHQPHKSNPPDTDSCNGHFFDRFMLRCMVVFNHF